MLPCRQGPNAKVMQSLAHAPLLDISACAANGDPPAPSASINARLQQRAAQNGDSSCDTADYIEIIDADPVGAEQLAVPHNAYSEHTAEGRAYPACMGAPLPAANDARVATLLAMRHLGDPPPPEIGGLGLPGSCCPPQLSCDEA